MARRRRWDNAYDPPRPLAMTGDVVVFDGDGDWVWLDTIPFDAPSFEGETMLYWRAGEMGLVLSDPQEADGYLFVRVLIPDGVGYYYADQLLVLSEV